MASALLGDEVFFVVAASRPPVHNVQRPTTRASQATKHMQFRFITVSGSGSIQATLERTTAAPGGALWS